MLDDQMFVGVQQRRAIGILHIDFVAGVILARLLHGGEKYGIVVHFGA